MIKRAALIFIPLAAVAVLVPYLLYSGQVSALRSIAEATEYRIVDIARQRATLPIGTAMADASYLAEQAALSAYLVEGDMGALGKLQAEYLAFARNRQTFDELRFLNLGGQEIVRVNRKGTTVELAPPNELHNLSNQYFVAETLKLDHGQIFVSPLDLDTEASAIKQPIKPIIRIGIPVFDAEGTKRGIIVITYLAQRILDRIIELKDAVADIWMLNSDGYWILGPKDSAFAFMYPERKDRTFAAEYPDIWRQMQVVPVGQITNELGRFTYARADSPVAPSGKPEPPGPSWFLLAYTPVAVSQAQTSDLRRDLFAGTGGLLILIAGVSWGLAGYQVHRRNAEQRIRASEARFRDLLESAPDAVLITDKTGRIQLANAQAERLFGHRREDMFGQAIEMLIPDRYRGVHVGHRMGYVDAAQVRPMGAGLELHGLRKDGSEFPVAISLSPTATPEGVSVFCSVRDITYQRANEAKIQELNRRLQLDNAELTTVNRELEAFSYSVSHDLRAPLRAIDGFSQALVEDAGPLLSAEHHGHLGRVRQAAQRMGLLIDDLIKLARVTRTDVKIEDVDLSAIAREIADGLQDSEPERQAEFIIPPGLHAEGDPRLLQVALENLLNNSWKFTAPRSPARIEFGETEIDGKQTFFVRDNGVGFDMTYAGKMFGAFQRFHDAREFAGTGIGLATVQRIIHKHGGRIWAESKPGVGATFFFTL